MLKSLQTVGCFLIFLVLLPQCFWIVLFIAYLRKFVSLFLAYKYGRKFKGLLSGKDTLFAFKDGKADRIINVMAYIIVDKTSFEPNRTVTKLMIDIRKRFKEVIHRDDVQKIFWQIKRELGYFYWMQGEIGPVEKYVDYMNFDIAEKFIRVDDLRKFVGQISNEELPSESNMEFLVANKPIDYGKVVKFPCVFRIHHSVADGSAILRIFSDIIKNEPELANGVINDTTSKPYESKFRAMLSMITMHCKQIITLITLAVTLTFTVPYQLASILFLRPIDQNGLHPEKLKRENVVNWIHESEIGFPLLDTLKQIKKHFPETRFNEIFAAALSRGIESYFKTKAINAPSHVTLFVTQMMAAPEPKLQLANKVGFYFLTLPIEKPGLVTNHSKVSRFFVLLQKVKQHYESNLKDLIAMEYIFNSLAEYFPLPIVSKMKINHATMCLSNLPGPQKRNKINGHDLHDAMFWQPNGDRIGICVSALSYDNKLNLGILADKAAIDSEDDAGLILKAMVKEIMDLKEALDI